MLIENIELEGIGPFRERLVLGPLQPGLNILAQSNEWGKSTVVQALGRALFDRYSSASEEIRQLRPAGSSLSPRIGLIFSTGPQRYRLVKRFLDRKCSELFQWNGVDWERIADSDRADQRVRELLGAPVLDGRIARPETWGLLRYLWARQDDPCCWPGWEGESGTSARRRLAAVEIDPIAHSLSAPLLARASALFGTRGKPRPAGPLAAAEAEKARIEAELLKIQEQRAALEQLEQQHQRLAREVPVLERERETLRSEAGRLQEEALHVQQQTEALKVLQGDLARAEAVLLQVRQDAALAESVRESLSSNASQHAALQREATAHDERLPALGHTFLRAENEVRENATARAELERRLQLVRERLKRASLLTDLQRLRDVLGKAGAAAADVAALEQQVARLGSVTPAQVERWREMAAQIREDKVRLESLGLTVELEPLGEGSAEIVADGIAAQVTLPPGTTRTIHAAGSIAVKIPGWGAIRLTSGAKEAAELKFASERRSAELQDALRRAGVQTVAEADVLLEQLREARAQLAAARRVLTAQLGEWASVSDLQEKVAAREAALGHGAEELGSPMILEAEEGELSARLSVARAAEASAINALDAARRAIEGARHKREEIASQLATLEARAKGFQEQQAMLETRHAAGLADAVSKAQGEFVRAEARLLEARKQLPPQAERLPERLQRATRAAAEAEAAWQRASHELRHLEGQLEERGGDGLYARESELEELLPIVAAEAARLRREGMAARLAAELIQQRERTAVRTVLRPLEDRLTEVFSGLTGIGSRRVWFDETLQVRGVGAHEDALVCFEQLSRGAREQLLLALRAAIALELAAEGPQCLVLDDVLVHTDAVRHQNVLDYLEHLSSRVQILLLTCHVERYRGLGHVLTPVMSPPAG